MNIKIGKAEFSKHEFGLLLFCLGFFLLIFIGAFEFEFIGKIFPLVISGPGLILVTLYLVSGFLPPELHQAMKKDTEFRLFGLMPEKDEDLPVETTAVSRKQRFRPQLSYTVLGMTMGYFLFSYLFSFYISTFLFTICYLYIFKKDRITLGSMISNLFLLAILMSMVYIFDYSFGYDFGKAAISKLF